LPPWPASWTSRLIAHLCFIPTCAPVFHSRLCISPVHHDCRLICRCDCLRGLPAGLQAPGHHRWHCRSCCGLGGGGDRLRPCPVKVSSYTSGRSVLVCIGINIALVVLLALLLAWWVCDCLRPPCPVKLSSYTSGVRVVLVACIVKFIWLQEPWPQVGVLVIPSSSLSS
jgi:hypothetical protein